MCKPQSSGLRRAFEKPAGLEEQRQAVVKVVGTEGAFGGTQTTLAGLKGQRHATWLMWPIPMSRRPTETSNHVS